MTSIVKLSFHSSLRILLKSGPLGISPCRVPRVESQRWRHRRLEQFGVYLAVGYFRVLMSPSCFSVLRESNGVDFTCAIVPVAVAEFASAECGGRGVVT